MVKISAFERRKELREFLDTIGILNINKSELGRKYGVSDVVIGKDIALIMKDSKPGDVNLILKKFDQAFSVALNRALYSLSQSNGSREVNDSLRTIVLIIHTHLSSLEKLGYKIDGDVALTSKPTVDQLNEFYEMREKQKPRVKFVVFDPKIPDAPIATDYADVDFRRPSPKKPEIVSPSAQDSPTVEEDDLIPVGPDDEENEEETTT